VATATNSTGKGLPIYYRGRLLLDALIDSLLAAGLSQVRVTNPNPSPDLESDPDPDPKAQELLWAGCSAGDLTTYLPCRLRRRFIDYYHTWKVASRPISMRITSQVESPPMGQKA